MEKVPKQELIRFLSLTDTEEIRALYQQAYQVKLNNVGNTVYFRGIIEFSNICAKDCYYCGIRKSNRSTRRYSMSGEEILTAAKWAYEQGFGSIVLQSGEREDTEFVRFIEDMIRDIKKLSGNRLGITLCLGEQEEEVYRRWLDAGAHRYLLRVETSNPLLYSRLHPAGHHFERRVSCLLKLQELGYQLGTGVMIGLPGQTVEDLADDILFFAEIGVDMIGMGPYLPHKDTPLGESIEDTPESREQRLTLGLKMIAATRIALADVNIAATTALQSLHPNGREMGLKAGANVIMPNITPAVYRKDYLLYQGKPCIDEDYDDCAGCLEGRIRLIGENIGYHQWGDSPHYFHRRGLVQPQQGQGTEGLTELTPREQVK